MTIKKATKTSIKKIDNLSQPSDEDSTSLEERIKFIESNVKNIVMVLNRIIEVLETEER